MCSNCENDSFDCICCISVNSITNCKSSTEVRLNRSKSTLRSKNQSPRFTDKKDCSHSMSEKCHGHADTFSQMLNADLHLVHLKPSPACICGHGFEDCIHFFLECPFYNENRAILLNKLKNYVITIELILAGNENLTPNQNIEIFSDQISKNYTNVHFNFLMRGLWKICAHTLN